MEQVIKVSEVNNENGNEMRISSLEIAEITGKPHNDLMKSIRAMEPAWVKLGQGNFTQSSYINSQNKSQPCYSLTRTECLYIATKFNDEARAKLVIRWEQLEKERLMGGFEIPKTLSGALMLAAKQAEEIEQKNLQIAFMKDDIRELNSTIENMETKVNYLDQILACKSTVKATIIAQDYGMSAKAFNSLLHEYHIQYKLGKSWVLYSNYLPEGYVKDVPFEITRSNGRKDVANNTQWTQKGRMFLYNFLKDKGVLPLIEQNHV